MAKPKSNSKTAKSSQPNQGGKFKKKSQYKKKPEKIYLTGVVFESLPSVRFKVKIDRPKLEPLILTCDVWTFFKSRVKIIKGDTVEVELDPQDLTKGIIVSRF